MKKGNNIKVSVIIPVFNEEKDIGDCLSSLSNQTHKPLEVILVDDGSTDKTKEIIKKFKVRLLIQSHKGPGTARNLGASKSSGEILVFVDADMTFDKNFVKDLVAPITEGKSIGTFSKNEMNGNCENPWSRYWNLNRGWPADRQIPLDYPNEAPVFRAILKKEFDKVNGFETSGDYTDDWSLSQKLGIKSRAAKGAVYYHNNPASLGEIFSQAKWIGKNQFISGSFIRRIRSTVIYSPPISTIVGIIKSTHLGAKFIVFKEVYDFGIWLSTLGSYFGEKKYK